LSDLSLVALVLLVQGQISDFTQVRVVGRVVSCRVVSCRVGTVARALSIKASLPSMTRSGSRASGSAGALAANFCHSLVT
jgi:hypothetical protein